MNTLTEIRQITSHIYWLRGRKVMIDTDLAQLYRVPAKALNQAVKRNRKRFPPDFMFRLDQKEAAFLRSQTVTLDNSKGRGRYSKYRSYVFTEQGVAMLSSILSSERAIQVNIQIMRVFSKIRNMLETHTKLRRKIEDMENRYDGQFKIVFDTLRKMLTPPPPPTLPEKPKGPIGFQPH